MSDDLKQAAISLLETIEATGGIRREIETGGWFPVGDPDWFDLGEAAYEMHLALGAESPLTALVDEEEEKYR